MDTRGGRVVTGSRSGSAADTGPGNLLCVANFRTNAGYAWHFIESLYAAIADELASSNVETWVAYPRITGDPASLRNSRAIPVELKVNVSSVRGLRKLLGFVHAHGISAIYLTDRAPWHPAYAVLRLAGVRSIIVHDHTSGERSKPRGVKRLLKRFSRSIQPALADRVLAVSEYVRRRKIDVDMVPEERVLVTYNSVEIPGEIDPSVARRKYGIDCGRRLIICACRAAEYKGVQHLLAAFQIIRDRTALNPVLLYFGNGPYLEELVRIRENMSAGSDVVFAGYEPNAVDLLASADVCVVPSVWGEAFGLAALEPAIRGIPVVATKVGGIPEVVLDGETGLLVPPADPEALARAIITILEDADLHARLAEQARQRALQLFSRNQQIDQLASIFRAAMRLNARV